MREVEGLPLLQGNRKMEMLGLGQLRVRRKLMISGHYR
jgi:hypothetical protein